MKTQQYFSKKILASIVAIIFSSALFMQAKAQMLCNAGFTSTVNTTTAAFTNTSTGGTGTTNYSWDFGDGNYATTATPLSQTHAYAYNGAYTVCLFMADSDSINAGCWSQFCDTIVITGGSNPPCHAAFSYYSDSSNTLQGVSFYDQSSYAVSWSWNFGDGNTSTQQSPVHQYASAGTYTVCLTIVNSFSSTCTYCSAVNYYPCNRVVSFTSNNTNDPQIAFSSTSSGGYGPTNYSWDFGDGNYSSVASPTHTYQYNGTYNVCLSASDSLSSCYASYCNTITIVNGALQPCNAAFYYYMDSLNTFGSTMSFYDASTGGPTTWSWNFGDGNTSTQQNPIHTYNQLGTYYVCLTIATPAGTCSHCDTVVVNNSNPSSCGASLYIAPDSANPLLWYVYSTVTGTAPFTYYWNFGDGNTSTLASPTHTYATAGHYLVCLTITDANGCSSSSCDSTYKLTSGGIMQYLVVVNALSGIEENTLSGISVFPNPTSDMIEVSLGQPVKGDVKITDMTGREVYAEKINAANVRVNVSNLPVGCYDLSVAAGTKRIHSKIMIVR